VKRLILVPLIIVLAVGLLFSSCAKPAPAPAPAPAPSPAPAPAPAPEPVTLVFTSHNAGGGFWHKSVIEPYFIELEKRTNGRVKVEQHWNGELVSLMDAYDAMLKGDVDLAEYFPSMLVGRFPMDDVVAFSTYYNYKPGRTMYELGQEFPQMLEPYQEAKLLWRENGYSIGMGTTKKQIRDIAGSKGIKLGPVGKWSSARMEALGWVPTPTPPEEATSALQTGVQEGSGISMYLLWEFGWGPIMKYITMPIRVDEMLVNCSMNIDTWNSLPKDIQDIINGMEEWIIDLHDQAVLKNAFESMPRAEKEFGTVFYTLPAEEQAKIAELTVPVQEAFIAELESQGLPGKELVERFLELDKKYSDPQYAPKQ
jgi:TRAP-type C4-dicarboxylate transport system substrate-binding protein